MGRERAKFIESVESGRSNKSAPAIKSQINTPLAEFIIDALKILLWAIQMEWYWV